MESAMREDLARRIVARLRDAGFAAYFAGGYARDLLLDRPRQDIDIATDAPPGRVQQLFERTVPVGVQFGVVIVVEEGMSFEVATFRSDGAYVDGRHPVSVRFGTIEEDARRRDFTINAMYVDPATDEVIDLVGAREDLAARRIRAVGEPDDRFREARLRMLRAVRFAARLGFDIEPATFAAIRREAATITDMAWERIGDEITRILTEGRARRGFELLDASGLLVHVLPEVTALRGVEQSPQHHPEGDVFTHTLLLLAGLDAGASETLGLGALLHDVGKPACAARQDDGRITFYGHCEVGAEMAVAVCQRLRRSREVWERVDYLVRDHLRHVSAPQMRLSTLKRFLAEEGIEELLALVRLDILASSGELSTLEFCLRKRDEFAREPRRPEPLLRGRDLLALGLPPGPQFKRILHEVEDAQLEGTLTSHEQALAWVKQRLQS
jgi:putative nucleotidyltransferase with HDIG domain